MQYWHALSDGWENMQQNMRYQEFLMTRRKLIAQVIRNASEN
jgi:hypothetical protein